MEFVLDNQTLKPISNEVEVLNGEAYRDLVLKPRIKPLLEAKNVQTLLDALDPVKQSLEVFGTVPKFTITTAKPGKSNSPVLPLKTVVDLTQGLPSNAVQLNACAINDRYSVAGKWLVANKLGLGDVAEFTARLQPKPYSLGSGAASIQFPTPVGRSLVKLTGFFFNEDRVWSSYSVASHGISAELRSIWAAGLVFKGGLHAVARNVHSIRESASDVVRAAAGSNSLKVSASAELLHQGPIHTASASIEAAGKPGDTQHIKGLGFANVSLPLTPGEELVLDWRGNAGYIQSDNDRPKLCDNFLIGGPGSVLGFKPYCMGPRDGSDFIGGQTFYTSSVALLSKVPLKPLSPLRFKTQVDAGVLRTRSGGDLVSNLKGLFKDSAAISTAAGLTYTTERASFDVLYVLPVRGGDADARRTGLHIGVDLNLA